MSPPPHALFNGGEDLNGLLLNRGLNYGDGVFRTLLKWDGRWLNWDRQIQTLRSDASALALDGPPAAMLWSEANQLTEDEPVAVLKIILTRRAGLRGYRSAERAVDRLLIRSDAPRFPASNWSEGIRAFRATQTLAAQPALAGIKHLGRLEQVLASLNWPEAMDEGICCDAKGSPICGTRTNLFWVRAGRLRTPSLDRCGVSGVMRQLILEQAQRLGVAIEIVTAGWEDLLGADEAFVSNSLIGLWPLRGLDGHRYALERQSLSRDLGQRLSHPRLISLPI